jgi:transcriptional regulator with XRE-family HTH domain
MGNLYDRISELCEKKGVKGAAVCGKLGISKGLFSDLKAGRRTGVSAVTAQKIATYFGVTVGYLLGEEEQKEKPTAQGDELSEKMLELINRVKELPEEKVELLLQVARSIKQQDR